ncbi:hypothetical protein TRIP_C20088 [Candidatus Zixiibacteriota bacterium]|nr:hypothetical protein TRIP_C20088 [candidate division Zixibacteria bacterium]
MVGHMTMKYITTGQKLESFDDQYPKRARSGNVGHGILVSEFVTILSPTFLSGLTTMRVMGFDSPNQKFNYEKISVKINDTKYLIFLRPYFHQLGEQPFEVLRQ